MLAHPGSPAEASRAKTLPKGPPERQPRPAGQAYPSLPQVLYKEPQRSFPGLQTARGLG